ncbi:hypothetical protein SAY86_017986 [Trapa natans]|uniref:GIR1-like zinc ribbon domain-containing protein n=1 Tax=Trapa natans TaxID=22666 RepID=A0AAN7R5J7_TRANT|nr:hypothetical protein SAY86_017986 [Trapa natans]
MKAVDKMWKRNIGWDDEKQRSKRQPEVGADSQFLSPRPPMSRAGTVLESPDTRARSFRYPPSNQLLQEPVAVTTSMVLVGFPRCLMYVMLLPGASPKCHRCKEHRLTLP